MTNHEEGHSTGSDAAEGTSERGSSIVATLDVPHERGRDLIWCAAFDLAWQELCSLLGGPVALRDVAPGDPAAALVRALNESPVTGDAVDPASYVALAGLHTEEWVRRVEAELRERFGGAVDARLLDRVVRPDRFVAYSYMAKSWKFPTPLMRAGWRINFLYKTQVEAFGLWMREGVSEELQAARVDEVLVHHFRRFNEEEFIQEFCRELDDDIYSIEEFVVEIRTQDPRDRLFIALCVPRSTFAATVEWVISQVREDIDSDPRSKLDLFKLERLEVPYIDFDLVRRYGELRGKSVANPCFEAQAFEEVVERIRFRLDEGGAVLGAEARIGGLCMPRVMVCKLPFLVLVLRRGVRVPMLAVWIETPQFLIRRTE